jgi:hypothetical protein
MESMGPDGQSNIHVITPIPIVTLPDDEIVAPWAAAEIGSTSRGTPDPSKRRTRHRGIAALMLCRGIAVNAGSAVTLTLARFQPVTGSSTNMEVKAELGRIKDA